MDQDSDGPEVSEPEEIINNSNEDGRERESDHESESDDKIKEEILLLLDKGPKSRLAIFLNFEKIDDTKIVSNLQDLEKIGKITHQEGSDEYSVISAHEKGSSSELNQSE